MSIGAATTLVAGVGVAVTPPRSRPEKQPLAAMARTADAATRRMKGLPEMKLLMVIQTLRARGKFRAEGGDTGRSGSGVQDSEPEVFLERVEVAVGVEQCVPAFNAEGGDDAIDGRADREAATPEVSVVAGREKAERQPADPVDLQVQESCPDAASLVVT